MKRIIITLILLALSIVYYTMQKDNNDYVLTSTLKKDVAINCTKQLKLVDIPFTIIGNNGIYTLKTTRANLNIAKMVILMSSIKIPHNNGLFLFDKSTLGTQSFKNTKIYIEAIENELSKILQSINSISSASVKIKLYKTLEYPLPSITIILSSSDTDVLTANKIKLIKTFISSSIANLKQKNILISFSKLS